MMMNPLDPCEEVFSRRDITLRSLVDEVISGRMTARHNGQSVICEDAIPDLIKLKTLFQNQVDYIEAKIQAAQN